MPILNPDGSIGFSSAQELAEYQKLMAPAPITPALPSSTSSKPLAQRPLPTTISATPKVDPNPRPVIDLPVPERNKASNDRRIELQNAGYRNATMASATTRFVLDTLKDYAGQVPNPNGHDLTTTEGRQLWMLERDRTWITKHFNNWTGVSMALRDRERLMWALGVSSALFAISICYGDDNAERAHKSISKPKVIQDIIDGCVEFVTLTGEGKGTHIHISAKDQVTLFERMFLVLAEVAK